MFQNMQGEYRAVIALEGFATESCILTCLEMTNYTVWQAENVKNHASFVM